MNKYIVFVLGYMGLIMPMCHGSAEAWKDTQQMENDISSYEASGFTPAYFAKIKQRIDATANVQVANRNQLTQDERNQIDNALRMLWKCKNNLSTIVSIQSAIIHGINNNQYSLQKKAEQGNPIAQALIRANISSTDGKERVDGLIEIIEGEFNKLAGLIYKTDSKDFTDLAIYLAFLHDNLKQRNAFYNFGSTTSFGSIVASMLALYERTTNDQIKTEIKTELKKIPHEDGKFGFCDNKIEDFSKSLRVILSK